MEWLRESACPVEVTMPLLRQLEHEGYIKVTFIASSIACDACVAMDGTEWELSDFINNAQYEAPIYSVVHPACRDAVKVSGPGLPDRYLNYAGFIE